MRTNWVPLPSALDDAARRLVEALRTLKDECGLTLIELGEKTHYSASSWERWLNGKRVVTRAALMSLADVTGADADYLVSLLDRIGTGATVREAGDGMEPPPTQASGAGKAEGSGAGISRPRPAELPRDVPDYVGRELELNALTSALQVADRDSPPVWAIVGMGGLGKTSLATRAAHQTSFCYPGGTLFLDLRGGGVAPLGVDTALLRLLHSIGIEDSAIPSDVDERAAMLRSRLAEQRILLVLDNALDAAQIRPLLPGSPDCGVIITSRNHLAGLEGVQRIVLDALSPEDSRALLAQIAGQERFESEPDDGLAILSVCAGLPLALRIAGSRLAVRPQWAAHTLGRRLQSTANALDELAVDDLAVRACFETSYHTLMVDGVELGEARALRLLGLWEGLEISLPAASALLGVDLDTAERELERLTDISLIQSPAPGRYRFHDLLHSFAAERARRELPVADQRSAVARLAAWYAHTAAAASDLMYDGRPTYDIGGIARPQQALLFGSADEAVKWYDSESAALVAISRQAQMFQLDEIAVLLPQIFQIYLESKFRIEEWIDTASHGLISARRMGSELQEAHIHTTLATAYVRVQLHEEAMSHAHNGVTLYERAGDQMNQARAMDRLARAYELAGDLNEARTWLAQAIEAFDTSGYVYGSAASLNRLGMLCNEAGLAEEAVVHLERSRDLTDRAGSLGGRAATSSNLGEAYWKTGRHEESLAAFTLADQLFKELGFEPGAATNLAMMGSFFRDTGHPDKAYECFVSALATLDELGHPTAADVRTKLHDLLASGQVRQL
ncbi:tetratricopeptide repeat protein [Catenulispora rubra]|uniref:tetratricopeptide repeat protein n=1 Tax=Catenulispora rubra TaxID=280293 RepID=UPI0018920A84|nr:helix-turn-helix domain-containing protein [Catenulispora rubra]